MTRQTLKRELGLGGAIVIGLGSILGTGAFVSVGLASEQWGDAVLVAIPLAGAHRQRRRRARTGFTLPPGPEPSS